MVHVPDKTTVNTTEYKPDEHSIGFAPELVQFIQDNRKLTTYRFGTKYDHFQIGDTVNYDNSATGERVGQLKILGKKLTTFKDLPLDDPVHEIYTDKEQQRRVMSGYYAYLGRPIQDNDPFIVFDFQLTS